jgi:DNA-binding NtrC family response regulator
MQNTVNNEEAHGIKISPCISSDPEDTCLKRCFRILHVDDDFSLLEVSKQILSVENNFEVENAISVDEAYEKMQKQSYDAVVSDYEMSQKNGLEFLKALRDKKIDIAFILFS